jgi:uncharacterized membrane protein YkvA (DUF1232 family)
VAIVSEQFVQQLKARARDLKRDTLALYFAARDPRTPWYAKALAGAVVAYALSPFDLIPDFIPVIGYLDDLIVVPLGVVLVIKLVPASVMLDCRERARAFDGKPISRAGAAFMIGVWLAAAVLAFLFVRNLLSG